MRTPMFEHQCDVAFSNWKLVAYLRLAHKLHDRKNKGAKVFAKICRRILDPSCVRVDEAVPDRAHFRMPSRKTSCFFGP